MTKQENPQPTGLSLESDLSVLLGKLYFLLCFSARMDSDPSGAISLNKPFLVLVALVMVFTTAIEKK